MKTRISMLMLLFLWVTMAEGRPGGGHSTAGYGGGGYGSSGGGVDIELIWYLIVLLFEHPIVGMVVIIVLAIFWYMPDAQGAEQAIISKPTSSIKASQKTELDEDLALLKQSDPNFSTILFFDFVHSLYNKFYSYSTKPEFSYLSPLLGSDLQKHFEGKPSSDIIEIVINGIQWHEISTQDNEFDSIAVDIDANYTQILQGKRSRYVVSERWLFYRQKNVLSPDPVKMQSLCCPFCGAPAQFTDVGMCEHCAHVLHKGEMHWYLERRIVLRCTPLATDGLVSYAKEQGTDLETICQFDLLLQELRFAPQYGTDWELFWQKFEDEIVKAFFLEIYAHWSSRDWQAVRHLLSDRLYEANQFWLVLYIEHNWSNRLDDIKIEEVVPVKVEMDKFYEAITVRIFASCYDYTIDADGKVIGGSKKDRRRYSEYWTFVRRAGTEQNDDKPFDLHHCPQCGAAADKMGQTAECGYCGSKISTGQFSWVLFMITQDDVYAG